MQKIACSPLRDGCPKLIDKPSSGRASGAALGDLRFGVLYRTSTNRIHPFRKVVNKYIERTKPCVYSLFSEIGHAIIYTLSSLQTWFPRLP